MISLMIGPRSCALARSLQEPNAGHCSRRLAAFATLGAIISPGERRRPRDGGELKWRQTFPFVSAQHSYKGARVRRVGAPLKPLARGPADKRIICSNGQPPGRPSENNPLAPEKPAM